MDVEELLCAEAPATSEGPYAATDPVLIDDGRVLSNLLALERVTLPAQNYFKHIQSDVEPYMRRLVATWMLEVCEEQGCEDQIFGVAINYFDRFLCVCIVQRTQLQLLGAVCLLLASKIRQCRALSVDHLAFYTENSVSPDEIKQWELVVLSKLGWSLTPVTGVDFLEHLARRLPGYNKEHIVRRHAVTFIALSYTEPELIRTPPSSIAMGALAVAIRGLRLRQWEDLLPSIATSVGVNKASFEHVCTLVEAVVERESNMLPEGTLQNNNNNISTNLPISKQSQQPMEFFDGNETPTDVTEILF